MARNVINQPMAVISASCQETLSFFSLWSPLSCAIWLSKVAWEELRWHSDGYEAQAALLGHCFGIYQAAEDTTWEMWLLPPFHLPWESSEAHPRQTWEPFLLCKEGREKVGRWRMALLPASHTFCFLHSTPGDWEWAGGVSPGIQEAKPEPLPR